MTSTLPFSIPKAQIVHVGWSQYTAQPRVWVWEPRLSLPGSHFQPLLPRHGPQNDHQISTRVTWIWLPCRRFQREGGELAGPRDTGSRAPMPPAQRVVWPLWAPEAPVGLPRGHSQKRREAGPRAWGSTQHGGWRDPQEQTQPECEHHSNPLFIGLLRPRHRRLCSIFYSCCTCSAAELRTYLINGLKGLSSSAEASLSASVSSTEILFPTSYRDFSPLVTPLSL